jgi:hypothetical protein
MNNNLIFLPVLLQVILTLGLYIYLAIAKSRALKLGEVDEERRALYEDAWPQSVQKINNAIRSQFEVPVLFYVLVSIFWSLGMVNAFTHVLAWLFVLSRFAHVYIHTGSNFVPQRRKFFTIGCLVLIAMTVWAIVCLLFAAL